MARAKTQPPDDERLCPFNNLLIEAFGQSGRNGRVGTLEKLVKQNADEIEVVKKAQISIQIKMAALSCTGAAAGGAAVTWLMRAFGG